MNKLERPAAPADAAGGPLIGFLTVVEHPQLGLFGGYLVLNGRGRPLEFHCTAPCKPNRAQEILYGPTLRPYLYGEQIGLALVAKAHERVGLICTDVEPALAVREWIEYPVVCLDVAAPAAAAATQLRFDPPHGRGEPFEIGRRRLLVAASHPGDRQCVEAQLALLPAGYDLSEPFGRIRAALEEAQRGPR